MPKSERKQLINKSAGSVDDIACVDCRKVTKHAVLSSVDVEESDMDDRHPIEWGSHYQIVQCKGCEEITFRTQSWHSEDYDIDDDGMTYNITTQLYPNRNEGRIPIRDEHLLPAEVQRIYSETIKAMNNGQSVLAGIGIRAIVETICRDKKAKGNNLLAKIDALIPLGVLTQGGAKILHQVRTLGNDAAHEVKPHKPEQLSLAMDVCEHLFLDVYLLPHHARKTFKKEKPKKKIGLPRAGQS